MSELKLNQLTIQDGHIFLNGTKIECVKEFNLKSFTDGTAELSLKIPVDLTSIDVFFQELQFFLRKRIV